MGRGRGWFITLTIVLAGGVYLLGNGRVALWDRDEPRFAQTSRQMLQSGDWVVPHYLDLVRTAKPALIYWCQAGAMAVFGDNAFGARFPSSVATIVLLVVLGRVLWTPLGPRHTAWTIFIFATSALTIAAAKICVTDAVLLLWVTIAQLCLYAMWQGNRSWPVVILFSAAVGLAGLTKGPVILGFLAMTLIALAALQWIDHRWPPKPLDVLSTPPPRRTFPWVKALVALVIVAAICLPWAALAEHRSPGFISKAFSHEIKDRMLTPLEQHKGPPGYYFLSLWVTFFPWSVLLPLAAISAWRRRADPRVRFCIAAIVGPWIMLECVRTKLPHYFLPAFPPLAILTADALLRLLAEKRDDLKSISFRVGLCAWGGLTILASLGPWLALLPYRAPLPLGAMAAVSMAGIGMVVAVILLFFKNQVARAAVVMGGGTLLLVTLLYGWYLPNAAFLRLSPRVAKVLIDHGVTQPHQVMMMDYAEPSLAFDQGGTIRESGPLGFSRNWLPKLPPWLVLTRKVYDDATPDVQSAYQIVDDEYGWAYADRGRWMHVLILNRVK